jgi:hypothetical protein
MEKPKKKKKKDVVICVSGKEEEESKSAELEVVRGYGSHVDTVSDI